jgi:hypothetical protein
MTCQRETNPEYPIFYYRDNNQFLSHKSPSVDIVWKIFVTSDTSCINCKEK